jgi:signal transduction histidine kinase
MEGLLELFGQALHAPEPRAVSAKVRATHDAFLARCGVDGVPRAKAELQKSGIDAIGDMVVWRAHFCLFYETKEDLLDALTSYCKSGLENKEYCLWVVTEPLTIEEARVALKRAVRDSDGYLADSSVEIVSANDFFLQGGTFDRARVAEAMLAKLAGISARGYAGVRLTGDTSWVTKKDWTPFCELEDSINEVIGSQRLAVLCTYSLAICGANEILDAVRSHQFALARREGSWIVIETAAVKRAKAEIKRLNEELEERVVERTSDLMKASEALQEAQAGLMRISRLTTMGELTASIAHEVSQPLAASIASGDSCTAWLASESPNLDRARAAVSRIIQAATQAREIVQHVRALFKKSPSITDAVDINELIEETIAFVRHEAQRKNVSLRTDLMAAISTAAGDRVQLQQVILNLIVNGIESITRVASEPRLIVIRSALPNAREILISVADTGPGFNAQDADRLFAPFFTTKPEGIGMGLPISQSIIETHGGRLWAEKNEPRGAVFHFTLPIKEHSE